MHQTFLCPQIQTPPPVFLSFACASSSPPPPPRRRPPETDTLLRRQVREILSYIAITPWALIFISVMGSPVVTPEGVLESLMNDGTIDAIRLKIINQLKANEELKNYTISMVEQSKVLNTPGAEKQTKRELFDALRQELESSVLEKASKAVWDLILDNDSLGKEISETVEKVFWRLSGREPPVAAPNEAHQEIEDREKEEGEKDREREVPDSSARKRTLGEISTQRKERDASDSSLRKRSFSELNMQVKDTVANGLAEVPSGTQDYSAPPSNSKA